MLVADFSLARRLELHEAQGLADYTQSQARLYSDIPTAQLWVAGGCAAYAGPQSPLNRTTGLGMAGPVTPSHIDQVEDFFRAHGVPARIDLCPMADPSLAEILGHRGYRVQMFLNVFARPLEPADRVAPPPAPGVTVAVVKPAEAPLWATIVSRGFQGEDAPTDERPNISLASVNQPATYGFLARVNGEPAGGATLGIRDGLASFFGTSTVAFMRGHGVQTALLQARLAYAIDACCDLATVKTTPGSPSQRNVQRAGFAMAYTRPVLVSA